MKEKYRSLSVYGKTITWTIIISILGILGLLVTLFFNCYDWLIGFSIGAVMGILNVLILCKTGLIIIPSDGNEKKLSALVILIFSLRMVILVTVILLFAYLYYVTKFTYINPFATLIGSVIGEVLLIVFEAKEKISDAGVSKK